MGGQCNERSATDRCIVMGYLGTQYYGIVLEGKPLRHKSQTDSSGCT